MLELQPWHWRSLSLENRSGTAVFAALFQQQEIATLLESPGDVLNQLNHARYSICAGRPRQYQGQPQLWTPSRGQILPWLRQRLNSSACEIPSELPFTGGWLGWLGYDLAWEIERLPYLRSDALPFPVAYWYEPEAFAVLDHQEQRLWLAATEATQLDELQDCLDHPPAHPLFGGSSNSLQPKFFTDQNTYEAMVLKAQQYIQAGDIFQANLSLRFAVASSVNSWQLYQALQQINPSPFASYWQTPWGAVVSCSPERLVQLQGDWVQTRPIAGTRPRGQTPAQDQHYAQSLLSNAKEQAEHIMLVDLERNDLGRVCQWGSVAVDELLTIESYSHVMHLVSNVVGRLQPQADAIALIRALFPGGTITGCPKVRCMEIIEELEPVRRSLFYGSCGYLDQRGNLDLNILIRTLLVTPHQPNFLGQPTSTVWGQVGAGIVADSNPEQEWQESLQKAQAQLVALETSYYLS